MRTLIKFIKKANMWAHTSLSSAKGKAKEEQKWFGSREEAEEYEKEIREEGDSKE